jgi:hypothetical protein
MIATRSNIADAGMLEKKFETTLWSWDYLLAPSRYNLIKERAESNAFKITNLMALYFIEVETARIHDVRTLNGPFKSTSCFTYSTLNGSFVSYSGCIYVQ